MSDKDSKDFFAQMVSVYWDSTWAFIYSMVRDVHVAGDLTQDTFIAAATRIHQLREMSRFKPWLFTIARNRCLDYWKSGWSAKVESMGAKDVEALADSGEEFASAEQDALQEMQRHELWNAIFKLKAGFREVVMLRIREELSFRDIAKVMKIREGTAKSRYMRAVEQLRGMMVKGGGDVEL